MALKYDSNDFFLTVGTFDVYIRKYARKQIAGILSISCHTQKNCQDAVSGGLSIESSNKIE